MKKSSLVWFAMIGLFVIAEIIVNSRTSKSAPQASASGRLTVDRANALVRESNQESKESGRLMATWDRDTNNATDIQDLQRIEVSESPILDQAVARNKHANELMAQVASAFKTPCMSSAVTIGQMADRDLALEVEKRDLLISSDVKTDAGLDL